MRFLILILLVICPIVRADITLTFANVKTANDEVSFDIGLSSDGNHEFNVYNLKIACLELTNAGPLTFTSEENLITGFNKFETNQNNVISANDGKSVGFGAYLLSAHKKVIPRDSLPVAKFTFKVGGGIKLGTVVKLGFITKNPGLDTGFVGLTGGAVSVVGQDGIVIGSIQPPVMVEVLCILKDAGGKFYLRWNGMIIPLNP